MTYQTHTLANGIRLLHQPDTSSVAYCGMAVNVGTRDENEDEEGMAHLVEHLLFKGTKKRRAWHILNRLESVGGELNAYTTKEETFVYAAVLQEDFERAMELIADIVFHSTFPSNEMEKEIGIVLDEINSYRDSPSELIFDDFEELLYNGYAIGKNILGNEQSLESFTQEKVKRFVERTYHPSEMLFFSLGNIKFEKIVHWAENYFDAPSSAGQPQRKTPLIYNPQKKTVKKDTFQAHYMLGNRACDLHDRDNRLALHLLNNILGGPGMNSFLNLALRERNALVYNVESNFSSYSDTGIWSIYFGCDNKDLKRCEKLVFRELEKLKTQPFSDTQLRGYKRQLLGQIAIASENKEQLILSMGKQFLHCNKVESMDETRRQIAEISAEKLQRIAQEVFDNDKLTTLIYE
ncbi:MAG: insulinase family protein [Prevotellaceae bacterium]|nr:insulinase family protein [Prevotellaceae bacterium]